MEEEKVVELMERRRGDYLAHGRIEEKVVHLKGRKDCDVREEKLSEGNYDKLWKDQRKDDAFERKKERKAKVRSEWRKRN